MQFSTNKSGKEDVKVHNLAIVGIQSTYSYENYLGLLALIEKSKIKAFKLSIEDQI
jgi:hypothetical protein